MLYKTILLELLQQHPSLYNQLRSKRILMPTLDLYARELKTSHEAWTHCLHQAMPGRNQSQIASEALEIALWEMETFLNSEYPPDEIESLSVEGETGYIRGRGSPV
jgi:hypothetical protein